jgi:hypothetical protein
MVEMKVSGLLASYNERLASASPLLACPSNLAFRADTNAISDMANTPFKIIKPSIISNSFIFVDGNKPKYHFPIYL